MHIYLHTPGKGKHRLWFICEKKKFWWHIRFSVHPKNVSHTDADADTDTDTDTQSAARKKKKNKAKVCGETQT
jgi:hypothetical protein